MDDTSNSETNADHPSDPAATLSLPINEDSLDLVPLPTLPHSPFPQLTENIHQLRQKISSTEDEEVRRNSKSKLALFEQASHSVRSYNEEEAAVYLINKMPAARRPTNISEVATRIRNGERLLLDLLSGGKPQNSLENIINLQWALFSRAVSKQDGFLSGTIVLEDPDRKIFDFLNSYQARYNRITSSHFKNAQAKGLSNKGIDIPDFNLCQGPLPGGKRHLLFGALDNGSTFLKWEDYGTKFKQIGPHVAGFLSKFASFGHDTEDIHRENVPKEINKYFQAFASTNHIKLTKQEKKELETHGIHAMLAIANKYNLGEQFASHPIFANMDNLELRKGNEVILTTAELQKRTHSVPHAWISLPSET